MSSVLAGVGPTEILGAAFSHPVVAPIVSLVIAVAICAAVEAVSARRERGRPGVLRDAGAREVESEFALERRVLGFAAVGIAAVTIADAAIRGYVLTDPDLVAWWRVALPVAAAVLGLVVVLARVLRRRTGSPGTAVVGIRRDWTSFGPRFGLPVAGVVWAVLVATTIGAGLASSTDGSGRYVWLELPIANAEEIDALRLPFYGWTYGVPVLVVVVLLAVVLWAVLHGNAARPYLRSDAVAVEGVARRAIAAGAVRLATAGLLLATAAAWRFVARFGTASTLVIEGRNGGEPFLAGWSHANVAVAAAWGAPLVEIAAFVLLGLVVRGLWAPGVTAARRGVALAESVR